MARVQISEVTVKGFVQYIQYHPVLLCRSMQAVFALVIILTYTYQKVQLKFYIHSQTSFKRSSPSNSHCRLWRLPWYEGARERTALWDADFDRFCIILQLLVKRQAALERFTIGNNIINILTCKTHWPCRLGNLKDPGFAECCYRSNGCWVPGTRAKAFISI